jgi:predicted transcriptional regulator
MKKIPSLGEQEMELLSYIDKNSPLSVRDAAQHFEKTRGLARTTVLTVMERLRKKSLLKREKVDGVFQYSSRVAACDVLSSKISDFVEKTLSGSLSPLFAYFASSSRLTDEELEQLQQLASKIERRKDV